MEIRKERQTRGSKGQENSLAGGGGGRCERWLWVKGGAAGVKAGGRTHRTLNWPLSWWRDWPLSCNIPHKVFRTLEKLTGIWEEEEELVLLPVRANNRAVCLGARHHVSRKELVVAAASGGRAPGAPTRHIKPHP